MFINYYSLVAAKDSVYKYIQEVLGFKIVFSKKEITVEMATEEDKELLDRKGFD